MIVQEETELDAREKLGWFYCIALVAMMLLILVPPAVVTDGGAVFIDGRVGRMDHSDLWSSMDPVSGFVYSVGDLLCHQMSERSYWISGNQMPVCAREFGMIAGALFGMILSQVLVRRIDASLRVASATAFVVMMAAPVEYAYSAITGADVAMDLVFLSGALSGFGFALVLQCIMSKSFSYASNKTNVYYENKP